MADILKMVWTQKTYTYELYIKLGDFLLKQ